jgi:hypothetical protein
MFRNASVRAGATALAAIAAAAWLPAAPARAQDGPTPKPLFVTTGSRAGARMGGLVCGAGDTDGDGSADVLVGTASSSTSFTPPTQVTSWMRPRS